jgi:hypothetical protein
MNNDKLITVVVWSTIVLVVYELYKNFASTSASTAAQLGGGTLANVTSGLSEEVAGLFGGSSLPSGLLSDPFSASTSIPAGATEIVPADGSDPTYILPGSSTIAGFGY